MTSHYLHGTDPVEQARLSRLNELLNGGCLRELNLRGGEKILDVGCGLGQLSRAMARAARTTVVGIERSAEQRDEALRLAREAGDEGRIDVRLGDVAAPPLSAAEWGSFDVAHARFILEHVRDPLAVVRAMVRAVRPGGRIVLQDDGHDILRLWPAVPALQRIWDIYIDSYARVGNDAFVGHRLVELLWQAGARPVRNTWLFFGACAGQPEEFAAYVANLISILRGVETHLCTEMGLPRRDLREGLAAFQDWARRPDAALWYAVSWAEGRHEAPPGSG